MVCSQCGREYDDNTDLCVYCRSQAEGIDCETAASESLDYESNLGFAKADSMFEASQVMISLSKLKDSYLMTDTPAISEVHPVGSRNRKKDNNSSKDHKSSKHIEKKLIKQRQLRLQQELTSRLHEEKLETLSQYMYQGLNQDIVDRTEEVTGSWKKDWSIKLSILITATVILLAVGILFYLGSRSEKTDYTFVGKDAIEVFSDHTNGKTFIFNSKGDMLYKIDGYLIGSYYTTDHTAAILYNINTRDCVYVNANKIYEFATPVTSFALSEDGDYIVYSVEGGLGKYFLNLYNVITDTTITLDKQDKQFDILNVLPGGKLITYITYNVTMDSPLQNLQSYIIRDNGIPQLVKDKVCVFAVSYDQKNLYYCDFDETGIGAIYVRHDNSDILLSQGINNTIYFNKDYSQILIEDDGSYYISTQGGPRQKVTDGLINEMLLPNRGTNSSREGIYVNYGIQSFQQKLLLGKDNTLQFLDEELNTKQIGVVGEAVNVTLSQDGKNIFYIDSKQRLVKVSEVMKNRLANVWAEGVTEYKASSDLSRVYYVRNQDLYYKAHNREELLISENVRDLSINYTGDTVFFLQNYHGGKGTLYYSVKGSPAKVIEDGTNVTGVKEWNFGVIYQKFINGSIAVFYNTEGTEFLFILDGPNLLDESNTALR